MNKKKLSQIRAEAGRKGGLARAASIRARKRSKAQQEHIPEIQAQETIQAINKLCDRVDKLIMQLEKQPAPKPKKQILVEQVDNKTAKRNIFAGLAGKNGGSSAFERIREQNKQLDDLAKHGKL